MISCLYVSFSVPLLWLSIMPSKSIHIASNGKVSFFFYGQACTLSCFSCVWLFATLWIVARQAPLSMGFSRQDYCSGLPFPSPGDLPNPGIEPTSLLSPALAGGFFTTGATWEALFIAKWHCIVHVHPSIYLFTLSSLSVHLFIFICHLYLCPSVDGHRLLSYLGNCKHCFFEHWGDCTFSN